MRAGSYGWILMRRKYLSIIVISLLLVASFTGLVIRPTHADGTELGWDFEDHSYQHLDFTALSNNQIASQLESSNAAFQAHGLPMPEHLAYPYGSFNQRVINVVRQYRNSSRTAGSGFINFPETYPVANWYKMSAACFSPAANWTRIQGWIDSAIAKKGLLNLFTHDVSETPTTYGCTPEMLAQILDYLVVKQNAGQLSVMTMREAYNSFDGGKAVVVVSFDDGYTTTYTTAWPMFKARGLKGTSYINTWSQDNNNPACMSWAMITEMAQPTSPTNWSVTISSNPSDFGTTTPSGLQNVTGTLTVTAHPATGYHFRYWLFDGYQQTDNPVTLPAQPNETSHTLTAFFSLGMGLALDNPPDKPINPSPPNGVNGVSTSVTLSAQVTDPDEDPMNVSFYQQGTQNFTIIALPDTQYYSASYPQIFDNQTKWIVNNAGSMNIVFVTHEGDIVDTWNLTTPWQNANRSMSKLDGYVPWGVLPGNHDLTWYGNPIYGENATYYNTYFGYTRFNGKSWYGGAYQTNNNTNSYQLFSEGKDDYLIFHLQFAPSDDVLRWANNTITSYPNRRVIVTTHSYLYTAGSRTTEGTQIWNKFVRPHADQIFLVLCGHIQGVGQRTDVVNGHTVYQLLADYQDYSSEQSGLLRILKFSPALNKIYVSTYSPYTNSSLSDSANQFTLNYSMTYSPPTPPKLIGIAQNIPSGGVASVLWSGLNYSTSYQWYAVATDPDGVSRQSDIWNFTTGPEEYSLTVTSSPIGGGSVSRNSSGPYYYGDKVQLLASPNAGWKFIGWTGDIVSTNNPVVITIDGNKTVTAFYFANHPPVVDVLFPNGGESLIAGINYTITWDASDADGDNLTYSILYSPDGGLNWISLSSGLNQTSYIWDSAYLQKGSEYLIKVMTTDGVNIGEDISNNTFTVRVHNVATTNVSSSKTIVGQGYSANLSVTVANLGDFTETFNVTIYANTTLIGKREISLNAGNSNTITFEWNTTGFAIGNYVIKAIADLVQLEFNTADNTLANIAVKVVTPGDVNADGTVDMIDVSGISAHWYPGQPEGPLGYDSNFNINNDGAINILDVGIVSAYWTGPPKGPLAP